MTTIKEDYVSFETAKLLKEKGFDEDCWCWYEEDGYFRESNDDFGVQSNSWHISDDFYALAPTLQMAMKWLREEKRTSIIIEFDVTKRGYCPYVHQLDYDMDWVVKWRINIPMKYEEAIEVALKYTLENLI